MTLSRFLRDYLYFSLGGNRHGPLRRYANLLITMVLGGLWHGAGWTFVIWGALHGIYLIINHAWQAVRERYLPGLNAGSQTYRLFAVALTFLCVVFGWAFFRAPTLDSALNIVSGMIGVHGVSLPDAVGRASGPARAWLEWAGIVFTPGGGRSFLHAWSWIIALALIAFFWPNTQTLMRRHDPALDIRVSGERGTVPSWLAWLAWNPSQRWALVLGVVIATSLLSLNRVSEFLYFQF